MTAGPPQHSERIVVTGASGFVGRHLLDRLVSAGVQVVAVSRGGTGRTDVHDVRVADYKDAAALAESFSGASAVVHLAARAHQRDANGADTAALYEEANVAAAVAVARASRLAGVGRLVLMSSIGVNGNRTQGRPFTASDVPRPVEEYARSKWKAEQAVAADLQDGPTEWVILRPPLVYGHGCPGNFRKLVQLVARAPLVPLGAVTALRTFVCVDNLVDAVLVAARHPAAAGRTFLISDAQTLTVAEVARILAAALGRSPGVVLDVSPRLLYLLARIAGKAQAIGKLIAELQVDGSEFSKATGWVPPVDPRQGLRTMVGDHPVAPKIETT